MRHAKTILILGPALFSNSILACPGCKDALANEGAVVNPWGPAFNWSILFMLGTVLCMFSLVAFGVYKLSRDEERRSKQQLQ